MNQAIMSRHPVSPQGGSLQPRLIHRNTDFVSRVRNALDRGNGRKQVFFKEGDYRAFLRTCRGCARRVGDDESPGTFEPSGDIRNKKKQEKKQNLNSFGKFVFRHG